MRRPLPTVAAVVLGVSLLAACSTGSTDEKKGAKETGSAASKVEDGAYPVTVKHRFGTTEITEEPKRIVTLGSADPDNALALGVVPVAVPKVTWGQNANDSTDWFDAELKKVGGAEPTQLDTADGVPVDEIAALEPDLILASQSSLTKQEYDSLSKFAKVVAPTGADWLTPWDTSLEQAGLALGRPALAEKVEDATEQLIESAEKENPELGTTSILYAYFDPADLGNVGVYSEDDLRVALLEDLGLEVPDYVENVVKDGEFYGNVSAEKADTLTGDLLITYLETDDQVAALKADPLLGRIPAVAADHVLALKSDTVGVAASQPTPLSIPVVVNELVPLIVAATQ